MAGKFEAPRSVWKTVVSAIPYVIIVAAVVMIVVIGGPIVMEHFAPDGTSEPPLLQDVTTAPSTEPSTAPSTEPSTAPPTDPPIIKESTATIGSTGDLLLHDRVIQSGYDKATGTYNYDNIFSVFSSFVSEVDYAVANLEVTLCGDDNGYKYAGYPCFNSPDAIVDAAKAAGFDMLLTANNHSFDTRTKGFMRTQEVIMDRGLDHIGSRYKVEDKNYIVKDLNGIKVGMICYTYNTGFNANGNASLNGIPLTAEATQLINSFSYNDLAGFYEKLSGEMQQMKEDGAEAIMLYIHWGTEYQTYANNTQKKMAQALCDLGIDVIVGNHAHVVQPVELLTNTQDESKKTLCLYSMGNAVSNIYYINGKFPVETEDGMLFKVTFAKYSDGTVVLESAEVLPTWVYRYPENGVGKYRILAMPTDSKETWQEDMELTDALLKKCQDSYDRTMKIVGEGLTAANEYYAQHQAEVEASIGVTK